MKKRTILGLGLVALFIQGCDFLDRTPEEIIETGKFFESANANALEQYCNDFYPKLIKGHGDPKGYSSMLENDWNSDNILPWNKNDVSFGHHIPAKNANDEASEWKWGNIRACNDFLMNYEKSPEADIVKQRYAGEVLFFKCMDYFNKLMKYGDLPWYDTALAPTDTEELFKGRDSRILVMDNLLRDISQAVTWLPKKTKVYRVSKDAALALKARMCLFEGTYRRYHGIEGDTKFLEAAYEAAGELMKAEYRYRLHLGTSPGMAYYELFTQENYDGNTEVILSKEYDPKVDKGNNVSRQIRLGENTQMMGMSKDCADDYLCVTTGLPYKQCCDRHRNGTTFRDELEDRDPRLLQTIATPYAGPYTYYLEGTKSSIATYLSGSTHSTTGYAIVKFYSDKDYASTHHTGTLDASIFRYGEVLLVRAEAAAELGKDPELNSTVNLLRRRVGFTKDLTASPVSDPKLQAEYPNVTGANADLIREIRRERRVELFGEGLRYADLMRWACGKRLVAPKAGMLLYPDVYTPEEIQQLNNALGTFSDGTLDVYGKRVSAPAAFEDPKHYLFSLPQNEMALNPQLKPNNPGWGE